MGGNGWIQISEHKRSANVLYMFVEKVRLFCTFSMHMYFCHGYIIIIKMMNDLFLFKLISSVLIKLNSFYLVLPM